MCIIDCLSTIVFILPLHLDYTKVIILILWWRNFQLEYWRTFQLVSTGNDIILQQIQRNYDQIKADAQAIINDEMERIKSDPELCERLGIESAEEEKS